ncbi:MAG: SDR family oxidoreductase [Candidatus Hinthialibacter antarcticus]|nr:SDR family oxidoreductase [Candidatus Hinthialibacter antarcticus]
MELKGKVAIITGASSGIGWAIAENLHEAGVQLVLTGRRAERLEELAANLNGAMTIAGDIADAGMPGRLLDAALERFGQCDIVVNNAGVMTVGPIEDIDIDAVCKMARINVEAVYRMAYVALKHFKSTGSGFLLNLSSILGTKVRPTTGAYAGTKYAIEALTEALRMELAKTDIGIACIEPGLVKTELHREWDVHPTEALDIPRALKPEDIARMARFILEQPSHVRIHRLLTLPTDQSI